MDRYIGIDVHSKSCTVTLMSASGQRLKEQVIDTNAKVLIETIRSTAGTRHVCFEEGSLSSWIYELLEPHVEELVVVQPQKRQRGSKSDSIDAWLLADNIRTGKLGTKVFKRPKRFDGLRQAVRAHQIAVKDMTRAKNRLNALYRSRGISGAGEAIYDAEKRTVLQRKLPSAYRTLAEMLSRQLDELIETRNRAEKWLRKEAEPLAEVERLMTVDGLGLIRAAQVVAVVMTPDRFRTKRQFWSYCGLGIVSRSSSDWQKDPSTGRWQRRLVAQTRGLNRNRSPMLKNVFKGAADTVIAMRTHPLSVDYARMLEAGTKPNLAALTIARRIAAAVLAIWKHKEVYAREKQRPTAA
jgi:transposase